MANENALLKQCYVLQSSHAKITIFYDIKRGSDPVNNNVSKRILKSCAGNEKVYVSNVTLKFILSFVSQANGS